MIGVLGGMGPMATVDLLRKITRATPAGRDQEHLRVVVVSDPGVPDRVRAILDPESPSPFESLLRGVRTLEGAGAECVVMACNTAHHWYESLQASTDRPILHIADAVCRELTAGLGRGTGVGLLATEGTLRSGFYQARLRACGFTPIEPALDQIRRHLHPIIDRIKAGVVDGQTRRLRALADDLCGAGAQAIVLGCTELPLLLHDLEVGAGRFIDATDALAKACVAWARARALEPSPADGRARAAEAPA